MSRSSRPARRTTFAALLVAAALAVSACSGSSDGGGSSKPDETTTTEPATSDAAPAGAKADGPAVPSAGCGKFKGGAVSVDKTYLDDSDRWFLLTTPAEDDGNTPLPLVLDIHGLLETAEIQAKMSELPTFGEEHGFIVVNPHGAGDPLRWNVDTDVANNADFDYMRALLDQLEATRCIDTSRIYATGLSNGAMMTSLLGCAMADRFAAIAPVSGIQRPDRCRTDRPVPVLALHGTADPILLFNGGVSLDGIMPSDGAMPEGPSSAPPEADLDGDGYPAAAQEWAEANGCTGEPVDEDLTDTVIRRTWDCPADGATEFLILQGGGHSWPGSPFSKAIEKIVGPTDDLDANQQIWDFFQRFQLPQS